MQDQINHIADSGKIALANTAAISVSFTEVEASLRIISLVAAIGYTFYKIYKEVKNERKK